MNQCSAVTSMMYVFSGAPVPGRSKFRQLNALDFPTVSALDLREDGRSAKQVQ
jgi:hypothetical protein